MISILAKKLLKVVYQTLGPVYSTKLAESWMGRLVFNLLNTGGEKIYHGVDGTKLKLPPQDAYKLGFFFLGEINPLETSLIKKLLNPGDVFIDIGAYIDGWYTIIASKEVGKNGHVYSIEPMHHRLLEDNVKLNKLNNVTISKVAISDKNGVAAFYDHNEASSLINFPVKPLHTTKVKTMALDSYVSKYKIKRIDLIKIDVEGAEMKVFKGATKTLKSKNAPKLLVEAGDAILKLGGSGLEELVKYLENMGYTPYSISADGFNKFKQTSTKQSINLLFTKDRLQIK